MLPTRTTDRIFHALGDPVRRDILSVLAGGPSTVQPLADRFPISRPAVSKHLRVLREAGLVSRVERGRTNLYRLEPGPLREAEDALRALWRGKLQGLKTLAEENTP